ncbi:MAG: SH3 domain-containing protein [Chloroflexota bacterium]
MRKRHIPLAAVIILLTASLACGLPAPASTADPNALATSIVQTVAARQTEAARANPPTATFTASPPTPSLTPLPSLTPTPDFTATPEIPLISVSVDTNCRTGPGELYERVGILLVGETAEVVGREPKGEFWYIRNPDQGQGPEFCWLWGKYATVSGNTLHIAYLSPEPPPASSFTVSFQRVGTCTVWWVDFRLTNSSPATFQSFSLTMRDITANTTASLESNDFTRRDGCNAPITVDTLIPGGAVTISSPPLAANPAGHSMSASITVCTDPDLKGSCLTRELTFKP